MIKIITTPPELQCCSPEVFFGILNQTDLTALKDAINGPKRHGPKFKALDATIRLYLWCIWHQTTEPSDDITVMGLRSELEDPSSSLAKLCRFNKKEKLPDRTTISNHIERINKHPELVRNVLLAINKFVIDTRLGQSSSKTKKAEERAGSQKGSEPRNRDKQNVDYRRRRRQEALGDEEFALIVKNQDTADDYLLNGVHGDHPECYVCPELRAKGWTCTRNHLCGVVVEMPRKPNKPREWKCHCCESKLRITRGTAFHGTHFSSKDILRTLRYMVHFRHGISAQDMAGFLNEDGRNVSEGAARMLMHRLRECMRERTVQRFEGETEIDEMLLRLNDGRQVSILSAYNRPTRCVRFEIIERKGRRKPKANKREMFAFIRKTTAPGSIILTDTDAATTGLEKIGRQHGRVNHKKRQFLYYSDLRGVLDKAIEVGTNRVEGVNGFLRRTLRIRNGVSRHNLERYLAEAMWRINHLHNLVESQNFEGDQRRNLSLMREVLAGAAGRKITLKDLRGEPQQKRDKSSKRTRMAPVPAGEKPEQMTLAPNTPIAPGTQQAEKDGAEVKADQPRPPKGSNSVPASHENPTKDPTDLSKSNRDGEPKSAKGESDPPPRSHRRRRGLPARQRALQRLLPLDKPAPADPLEERDQALVA